MWKKIRLEIRYAFFVLVSFDKRQKTHFLVSAAELSKNQLQLFLKP